MTAIVTGKRVRPQQPLGPIPQGSESLEVWSDLYGPTWIRLGTIIREGGRHGKIVCTPKSLECLLRRPQLLGYDEMAWLTRWTNTAVAVWPKGKAPGAPTTSAPVFTAPGLLSARSSRKVALTKANHPSAETTNGSPQTRQ